MKVNTTLLDLATIYETLTHGETLLLLDDLTNRRVELLLTLSGLLTHDDSEEDLEKIYKIETQLFYLNQNIETVEEVLMCYESKISEKRTVCGGLINLWLN